MKKTVCFMVIIALTLVLSSCVKGDFSVFSLDSDDKLADDRMEDLFDAIERENRDDIKRIFSEKAVNEAVKIDTEIEQLLSFVQGDLVSWSRDESPIVFDSVQYGSRKKQLVTWYTLNTDKQKYLVLLVDYPVDTIDPENAGLYSMRILRAEDENKLVGTWVDWMIPGVYIVDN